MNEPHFLHYALELKGCYFDRRGRLALDRKLHHNQIRGSVETFTKCSSIYDLEYFNPTEQMKCGCERELGREDDLNYDD